MEAVIDAGIDERLVIHFFFLQPCFTGRPGRIDARVELGELQPEEGLVVLRYRFHPAWKAVPAAVIEPYPIPEDRAGFIALRNPPPELILEFDTRAMLTADWPESADRPTGYTPEL